jgi:hypothetical protein
MNMALERGEAGAEEGRDRPTPADAKARQVRTYARKVRSDARWSRATEPVFRRVSERLNHLNGACCAPAPAAARTVAASSALGWEEYAAAAAEGLSLWLACFGTGTRFGMGKLYVVFVLIV